MEPGVEPDPVVPVYVITHGRAAPTRNTLQPETLLLAADPGADGHPDGGRSSLRGPDRALPVTATREQVALLRLCQVQLSVAEVAAYLRLPVSAVTVVAADLIDGGHLIFRAPASRTDLEILKEVLDGLRNLV
ncbi:DUF742 domain-containing protein [Actinomadura sp. 7K507]|uniref:DUF742 domain-containing protein n=1 Tax=Actinomadura sp. 7K507 TaxID=2530365 RepID=UPI00104351B2|nr:DUF742 domain-containing protein [Actinomadura sp. 7K507]TDC81845.1 DUF742 domain-containing protein [Actinomadura sp. 7K507]